MNLNRYPIIFILSVLFIGMLNTKVIAQQMKSIQLLDQNTFQPITDASFQYGDQSGISNEQGAIEFFYAEGQTMLFSHITYGEWQLTEAQLLTAIVAEVYYRENVSMTLYPVTVIAIRPNYSPLEKRPLNYQDHMAHDGAAILNQSPAINSIRKSGQYGFDPVFRGFKYDQLNIVLNGAQSATAACPNRMDPPTSQMAPNMMDRIEVLKGPHALRYGTGFGGTINFIPAKLRFSETSKIYGRLSAGGETNGSAIRSEGLIGFSGKNYDLGIFESWSQGNDYLTGDGVTVPSEFTRGSFGANLGLKLSGNQQLRISAIYNLARDASFPALPMDLRNDDTWMFNARHEVNFNTGKLRSWNTTLFASFVDHLMDNLLKPLDPRMLNAATSATTRNYSGRTEGVWKFAKSKIYAGADLRIEGAEGIRTREFLLGPNAGKILKDDAWQNGQISKTGLFAEYHFSKSNYEFVASARAEFNKAEINDPSEEFTQVYSETGETQINPSISLGVSKKIGKETRLGFWLARGQRSAGLTERFINYFPVGQDPYEMLGNPQLVPEVNNQADVTFAWKSEKTALNVDVYISYLQDFISSVIDTALTPRLPMSPGVRQFVNLNEAFKTGFEINWTQQLPLNLQHQFGVAYTYAQDIQRAEPLPEIAPLDFKYTLHGYYFKNKFKPEITFRHVLQQSRISTEFGETKTPAFSLLDINLSYQIIKSLRCSLGVNNLLDENYYEHLNRSVRGTPDAIYAIGRSFTATFNLTF